VEEQEEAMDTLKRALTTAPALKPIDYHAVGTIFLSIDSLNIGWGAILQQEKESTNKHHPARFESGVWNEAEKKYDGGKLECRGLLKALKKLRVYLYGVRFVMEIDARTLVHQLNLPASDLLGSVVNRWLAWIRLLNFDIKHVAGKKHGGPDSLSRRKQSEDDSDSNDSDELDECIDADLMHTYAQISESNAWVNNGEGDAENDEVPDKLRRIKRYLLTLARPDGMTDKAFRAFVRYTTEFLVNEGLLFRRAKLNMPPRRVIWDRNEQNNIIQQLQDESGHRGKKGTYQKIVLRYWWKGLYCDVEKEVKTCEECQKRSPIRVTEELHPTLDNALWQRVGLDMIHMTANKGFSRIVAMREYLSRWVEAKALKNTDSENVVAFVHEWIVRFGAPGIIIHDNGAENQKITKVLIERHHIKNISIARYHPQSNILVERGHQQIGDRLAKLDPK